jgi:hypothetical protein
MPLKENSASLLVDNNDTKQSIARIRTNRQKSENESYLGNELSELPFLVTHWLSAYQLPENTNDNNLDDDVLQKRNEAVGKIHRAATDIAAAFSSLASFGKSFVHVSIYILSM